MIVDLFRDYNPHPGQARFRASRKRFKNLLAGRRYGKDYCGARETVRKIFVEDYPKISHLRPPSDRFRKYTKPLLHYWAVAPDHNIGKIQQREIFSIFPPEFIENKSHFDYDDNRKELRLLGGRVLIEFKSADRPDTLVGVGLNGVYCTEFARFKETAWDANIRPTLTDKRGWGIFTSTPLPKKWYKDFVAYGDPGPGYNEQYENFRGKTVDNTRLPGIREEIEMAKKTMPRKYFLREYEADMTVFEGQIYEEYGEEHRMRNFVRPKFDIVVAGVDWGFAEPGCIEVAGVAWRERNRPTFYFIDEVYEKGLTVDGDGDSWIKRAKILQAKHGISVFYCDTEEPGNIQMFRDNGINAVGAAKDVDDGIQSVAVSMHISEISGLPNLFVNPERCPNLDQENVEYVWGDDERPAPRQKDHAADAERYLVHSFKKFGGNTQYLSSGYGSEYVRA